MFLQEAAEFEDRKKTACCIEVSGRTFSGLVNRNDVSEANHSRRNVANSLVRDAFGSSVFHSSSVHVERPNPILEASFCSFHRCRVPRLKKSFLFHREIFFVSSIACQAAAFQSAPDFHKAKDIFHGLRKLAERSPMLVEERNRGSPDS